MNVRRISVRKSAVITAAVAATALLMPTAAATAQAEARTGVKTEAKAEAKAEVKAEAKAKAPRTVSAPGFLAAADMPDGWGTEWQAGPVTKGNPEFPPGCMRDVLPAKGATWHRAYWTDLETSATQISVTTPTVASARRLVAAAEKAAADCAADSLRKTPGGAAAWDDYGKIAAEDGAHVYGVHTEQPYGALDVALIGIGRDGRTVTFVDWGQMGYLKDLPVEAFKKTMAKAVNDLR
ncbi:hypothetical protein I3F58_05440 [Streptomyces sp. MUM 203J]|uniref:hypothetical protein n=1 Tax=Streptomyces sp. MUM 203J TaxID=2791990 RepID=UPI001F0439D1|nr:hypothetical protein [Streptomyces sp. MUM 203J]MCH0539008.1 hypothetical protein [Streptomyces sp. MUM 203J]